MFIEITLTTGRKESINVNQIVSFWDDYIFNDIDLKDGSLVCFINTVETDGQGFIIATEKYEEVKELIREATEVNDLRTFH